MALQQVARDWLVTFDTEYIDRLERENRLTDKALACRSCGKDFNANDIIHNQYKSYGSVKRHLVCSLVHKVLTMSEAKELARHHGLEVDWQDISEQVKTRLEARKLVIVRLFYWILSGAFLAAVSGSPLL